MSTPEVKIVEINKQEEPFMVLAPRPAKHRMCAGLGYEHLQASLHTTSLCPERIWVGFLNSLHSESPSGHLEILSARLSCNPNHLQFYGVYLLVSR